MRNFNLKRSKKRKVKGMTLIECIIALAVFSIAGLLVAQLGSTTKQLMMNTNHLNNKTEAEAAVGANRNIQKLQNDGTATGVTVNTESVQITVGGYGTVDATRYSTKASSAAVEQQALTEGKTKSMKTNLNEDVDLEFYTID